MTAIRIGLAGLLAVFAAVAIISAIYQGVSSRRVVDKYPAPGVMVDVGGYRLHFNCTGKGDATVILEAGGGTFSLSWALVQAAAAKAAGVRVCSYDRAGLGWSEPYPGPYSVMEEIEALHLSLTTKHLSSTAKMLVAFSRTLDTVRASAALPDVLLTIITRGKAEKAFPWGDVDRENAWREGQERISRAAPQGKLIVAAESGHMVPFDQPELIVDAIRSVIKTVRNKVL